MTRERDDLAARFRFSAELAEMDRERIHAWLSEQSYWAKGRAREVQERAFEASLSFGMFDADSGVQVAYARVVTDMATFGWLCDVFVVPEVRGQGVGTALVEGVMAALESFGLKRVLLATADAHDVYARHGFTALEQPARWMAWSRGGAQHAS